MCRHLVGDAAISLNCVYLMRASDTTSETLYEIEITVLLLQKGRTCRQATHRARIGCAKRT